MSSTTRLRRLGAALLATLLFGGLVLAPPAPASQTTETSRLSGANRFATAAAIAKAAYPTGSTDVVLATGLGFADALAAAGLAGAIDAPILLTTTDSLPGSTATAIDDLDPDTIHIIGGTAAVSADLEAALDSAGYTTPRYAGAGRFETAALVGAAIDDTDDSNPVTTDDGIGSSDEGRTAIVVSGLNFPDAVSASQVSAAGRYPILLADLNGVPAATMGALDSLSIDHVLVVGGTSAVSAAGVTAMEDAGYTVQRIAGTSRYATSVAVAVYAEDELDFGGNTAYLATGDDFADALGGGVLAGKNGFALVLSAKSILVPDLEAFLVKRAPAIDFLIALGGTAAITDATLAGAADAAKLDTNEVIAVDPGESATNPLSTSAINSDGARTYTASGLTPSTAYRIALLDPNVVNKTGGSTFISAYTLSSGADTAIESVGGTTTGAAGSATEPKQANGTANAEGTLSFIIDATSADSVFPVVYRDENGNNELDLDGSKPTEPFGVGGRTSWLLAEAPTGTFNGKAVKQVNLADNWFVTDANSGTTQRGDRTYFYADSDRFRYLDQAGATQTTDLAGFEGMLTVLDSINISYQQSDQSLFTITTDDIPDMSGQTASLSGDKTVTVSWTPSKQVDTKYEVYRDDNGNGEVDNDRDGEFEVGEDKLVSALDTTTSREFTEDGFSGLPVKYLVLPQGGVSENLDTIRDAPGNNPPGARNVEIHYLTNEVVPAIELRGLVNGTTVSTNAGLSLISAGDIWMLHFTKNVSLTATPSLTLKKGASGEEIIYTPSGSDANSTWSASGSTVTITLGTSVNSGPDISYGTDLAITAISGISSGSTQLALDKVADKGLEDNGPDLMQDSSSCDVGDSTCTIAFNEPVGTSANSADNYSFSGNPQFPGDATAIDSVTLGADKRTITLVFDGDLASGATISPTRVPFAAEVADDDGQAATQGSIALIRGE